MKFLVKFDLEFDLKFEISDGKQLVKFWGRTFRPARKAQKFRREFNFGANFRANFGENFGTSFQISRLFSETSFSRRAAPTFSDTPFPNAKTERDERSLHGVPGPCSQVRPFLLAELKGALSGKPYPESLIRKAFYIGPKCCTSWHLDCNQLYIVKGKTPEVRQRLPMREREVRTGPFESAHGMGSRILFNYRWHVLTDLPCLEGRALPVIYQHNAMDTCNRVAHVICI